MVFLTVFLGSCSRLVSEKMHAFAGAVQGITFAADRGEIYVPLDEGNPARFFYEWIDVGTPVRIRH
jgi:hypothetical protein